MVDYALLGVQRALAVFKRLRIAVLLYVLLIVAGLDFLSSRRATDWDTPLWVDIYSVAGDGSISTQHYIDKLRESEFAGVEAFLAREAHRYGITLEQPVKIRVVGRHADPLPLLEPSSGPLGVLIWSLRMRWLAARLRWQAEGPTGDILVFAVYHEPAAGVAIDRSTALHKGLIAVANLFAASDAHATNQIVLAHELLHTLRATDKYSRLTNAPVFPEGYADPEARPLLPQSRAELMAGRIPIAAERAEMPNDLRNVMIGEATAREIGWQSRGDP